jgi:hypothetical protein
MRATPHPVPAGLPRRRLLASAAVLASVGGLGRSWADPLPSLPDAVLAQLPDAQWTGTARLRYFGFSVYDANLWVAPGFSAADFTNHALALDLTYLRTLSGSTIAERSLKEMQRSGNVTPEQAERWLAAMQATFSDVNPGDRLIGLHSPTTGARFWLNGITRTAVPDPEFSRRFFGIWLANSTSEPQMRSDLLTGTTP